MLNEKASLKSTAKAALYLLPMLVITITFNIWPIINSFLMSLYTKYDFYTDKVSAWGFDNFVYLWNDPDFHLAVRNTLVFVVGVVPITVILSLIIALLLNQVKIISGFFRTVYFLPFVTSTVAIAMVWNWMFHSNYGLINYFMGWFGVHPINWLTDPHYALLALIIMSIWKSLGFNIILFWSVSTTLTTGITKPLKSTVRMLVNDSGTSPFRCFRRLPSWFRSMGLSVALKSSMKSLPCSKEHRDRVRPI